MLVFDKGYVLTQKAELIKHSADMGEVSDCAAFVSDDTLTVSVRVPRLLCASAARLSLYRDDDMTTSYISADKTECTFTYDS